MTLREQVKQLQAELAKKQAAQAVSSTSGMPRTNISELLSGFGLESDYRQFQTGNYGYQANTRCTINGRAFTVNVVLVDLTVGKAGQKAAARKAKR